MGHQFLTKPVGEDTIVSRIVRRIFKCIFANKSILYPLLLVLFLVTTGNSQVHTQYFLGNQDAPFLRPVTYQESDFLALLDSINAKLAQPYGDTVRTYVTQSIAQFCGQDYDCLINLHHRLRDTLFNNSHYLIALTLGQASVQLALQNDDPYNVGLAYVDLSFYYEDLGRVDSMIASLEKSLPHFEKSGACFRIFKVKTELLERKYGNKPTEIVPLMEKNLEEAKGKGCKEAGLLHILKRLVEYTERGSMWDMNKKYLEELEQSIDTTSDIFEHRHAAIYTHLGRAKIYLREAPQQIEKANEHLLRALKISYDIPYPLFGVEILYRLARLEWSRQQPDKAFAYLEEAISLGKKNQVYHHLSIAYRIKAEYLEKQGRFQEALEATRNDHRYSNEHREMLVGLDLRDYYMEIEKNQMAAEQKNKALQIQLKDSQLRNSTYIIVSILLLSLALLYGFFKLRKQKSALAKQNTLIQQQAEQLKQLDKAKSSFFANVSHELRTPLTLMLGPIKSLLKGNHSPEQQEKLLNIARQSGQQLQQLINEILDLRKLEMGKMEVHVEPTLLTTFFNRHVSQFESWAKSKQIDFSYETTISEDVAANIDQEKCRQILYNLISNALKFTPAGGWARVNCSLQGNNFRLQVSDSGSGIPPEDLPHVFDRYFQSGRPDKPAEGGTGIGLALCQEYARLFGGSISVESTVGKGSVFSVEFPVTLADTSQLQLAGTTPEAIEPESISQAFAEAKPLAASLEEKASKPTILLVEDNPELQAYIRLILEDKYHVITAGNGQEALESQLPTANYQLIISDLMMPVMDGYQLLERLKSDDSTRHIPVIMLTARAEAKDKLEALRIGVDDYLTKPFDEEELLVRIENLLNNQAARRNAFTDETAPNAAPLMSQPDREWLETFEGYVQKHFSSDILSVSSLAQEFAMSESTLLRQLKRLTGLSPIQYIQEVRLNEARLLLENRSYSSIAQVASKVGYVDARTFTRSFKQRFGKSPSEMLVA